MKRVRKNIEKTKRSILLDWKETDRPSYILLAWVLHLFAPQSLLLTLRVCGSCTFFFFKIKTTNRNVPLNIRLISRIFHDTSFLIFHSRSNFPTLGVRVQEFRPLLVSMSKLQLVVREQFCIWKHLQVFYIQYCASLQ